MKARSFQSICDASKDFFFVAVRIYHYQNAL
jgi:hypothetical protein